MTTQLQPVTVERDRFGRPLIIPPHGGRPIPYTRCTTYVGALEDTYNLGQWQMRMVASGLASRPELIAQVKALEAEPLDDGTPEAAEAKSGWKTKMGPLVDAALEAAKASDKARLGTEFHHITERLDRDGDLTGVAAEWQPSIDAFIETTKGLKPVAIEQFLVNDEHQVAGTADRVYQIHGIDGYVIGDLKTGNVTYGIGKIAMQLAMYAHSQLYDLTTGARTPIPGLRTDIAIVMDHSIPAVRDGFDIKVDGTRPAECRLLQLDLAPAWDAIQLAKRVRGWRSFAKPKNLSKLFRAPQIETLVAALDVAIANASSRDEISRLWTQANAAGTWTPAHTAAAKARLAVLEPTLAVPAA